MRAKIQELTYYYEKDRIYFEQEKWSNASSGLQILTDKLNEVIRALNKVDSTQSEE
jgi:hypothetical protein